MLPAPLSRAAAAAAASAAPAAGRRLLAPVRDLHIRYVPP